MSTLIYSGKTNRNTTIGTTVVVTKESVMSSQFEPNSIKVALLAGGKSGEREVSLSSGKSVEQALKSVGFIVEMLDPANKEDLRTLVTEEFDVAFLALHGKGGEDGTIQGFLETLEIPYTGSGVWASATAVNKIISKHFYNEAGIPTPQSMKLESSEIASETIIEEIGLPCVVKAATEGSALGVYICNTVEEVTQAVQKVFTVDNSAFVESFISGNEFTVGVLGQKNPTALPVIKIIPVNEFYDYESKYAEGGSQHICPAPLSEEETRQAQELALRAHKVLGCEGVSRTDVIQDEQGKFWVLETNTLPGMTATSLLPDAARVQGITFEELCKQMVFEALEK